jgi:hypothetical protein
MGNMGRDMMTVQEKPKKYKLCTWEKGKKKGRVPGFSESF